MVGKSTETGNKGLITGETLPITMIKEFHLKQDFEKARTIRT